MKTQMTHEQALLEIKLIEEIGLDNWLENYRGSTQSELARQLSVVKPMALSTINSQVKAGKYTSSMLNAIYGQLVAGRI